MREGANDAEMRLNRECSLVPFANGTLYIFKKAKGFNQYFKIIKYFNEVLAMYFYSSVYFSEFSVLNSRRLIVVLCMQPPSR